jgi:NADPH-dependent 2,4-dienoyl-CoA reductase/sulfur reductase-like enzyme
MARNIVMIGGGPAAVFAAIEIKRRDGAARVTLVTDEGCEPYEKPPLSKDVLLGKAQPEDVPIAGPGGLAARGAAVKLQKPHGQECLCYKKIQRDGSGCRGGVLPPGVASSAVLLNMAKVM